MFQIEVADRWHDTFPGGYVGVLLIGNVDNARRPTPLDQRKKEIESRLRVSLRNFLERISWS